MKTKKILAVFIALAMLGSAIMIINTILPEANIRIVDKAAAETNNILGIDIWEWDDDVTNGWNFVNTSGSSLYYGNDLDIQFNKSVLNAHSSSTFYLYHPVYTRESGASGYEYNVTWTKWTEGGEDRLNSDGKAIGCNLDVAGCWFVSDQFSFEKVNMTNHSGTAPKVLRGTTWHDIVGMFCVNHTTPYTVTVSPSSGNYGYNETVSIKVYEGDSLTTDTVWIDIRKDDTGGPYDNYVVKRKYLNDGSGQWDLTAAELYAATHDYGAGIYNIVVYRNEGSHSSGDFAYGSASVNAGYNNSFGNLTSGSGWESLTILNSTSQSSAPTNEPTYYHRTCGPFDPPEYQAEIVNLTVESGEPTTSVAVAERYWNDTAANNEINITVKNYDNQRFNASSFSVQLWNKSNKPSKTTRSAINPDYYNVTYPGYGFIHIKPNATGVNPNRWGWNKTGGTWAERGKVYVTIFWNRVGNDTEEWNGTTEFELIRARNTFTWMNDGSTQVSADSSTDITNGILGKIPSKTEVPVWVSFRIISSEYNYFGDVPSNSGSCTTITQCAENITISGNSLFTGTVDTIPGYATTWFNANYSNAWSIPIIPTMSQTGGTITITARAWNKTITGTLLIGDSVYYNDGSVVSVTPNVFNIDVEDQILSIDVLDANGNANPYATVELFYLQNGVPRDDKPLTPSGGIVADANGVYSWNFNTTQQTTNQTAIFGSIMAPRNLSLYVTASNAGKGWALIKMLPNSDFEVMLSHDTFMAGMVYNDFTINCEIYDTNNTPSTETADKNNFHIKIFNQKGSDVTNTFDGSDTINGNDLTGGDAYLFDQGGDGFDGIYCVTPGTYTFYAYNNTHDSTGHNGTLVVKPVTVTCDRAPFIWMSDKNISATFTITYNSVNITGYLRIDNMSEATATAGTYNRTWMNTSFNGDDDQNTGNDSIEIHYDDINENGAVTINDITANFLPTGESYAYLTCWFKPINEDDEDGGWARAVSDPRIKVQVPDVDPEPDYVPMGRQTSVTIDVLGRMDETTDEYDLLGDVYVRLHGAGVDQNGTSATTGSDKGKVKFSINPQTTGNISIDVGEEGRTLENKVIISTGWVLNIVVSPSTVDEGDPFTVKVTKDDTKAAVKDAVVKVLGHEERTTNENGEATFNAPSVTSDRDYTITASADGYAPEPDQITVRVTNIPKLEISADLEVTACTTYEIVVSNTDTGLGVVGATVTIVHEDDTDLGTYTTKGSGVITITAPEKTGKYTITATYESFKEKIIEVTVVAGEECDKDDGPGFELLTLIIAIGVALILLKRRRKK